MEPQQQQPPPTIPAVVLDLIGDAGNADQVEIMGRIAMDFSISLDGFVDEDTLAILQYMDAAQGEFQEISLRFAPLLTRNIEIQKAYVKLAPKFDIGFSAAILDFLKNDEVPNEHKMLAYQGLMAKPFVVADYLSRLLPLLCEHMTMTDKDVENYDYTAAHPKPCLRTASAQLLDALGEDDIESIHDDLLRIIEAKMESNDWKNVEAGVLAFGAVARQWEREDACPNEIFKRLLLLLQKKDTHPIMASILCWSVSQLRNILSTSSVIEITNILLSVTHHECIAVRESAWTAIAHFVEGAKFPCNQLVIDAAIECMSSDQTLPRIRRICCEAVSGVHIMGKISRLKDAVGVTMKYLDLDSCDDVSALSFVLENASKEGWMENYDTYTPMITILEHQRKLGSRANEEVASVAMETISTIFETPICFDVNQIDKIVSNIMAMLDYGMLDSFYALMGSAIGLSVELPLCTKIALEKVSVGLSPEQSKAVKNNASWFLGQCAEFLPALLKDVDISHCVAMMCTNFIKEYAFPICLLGHIYTKIVVDQIKCSNRDTSLLLHAIFRHQKSEVIFNEKALFGFYEICTEFMTPIDDPLQAFQRIAAIVDDAVTKNVENAELAEKIIMLVQTYISVYPDWSNSHIHSEKTKDTINELASKHVEVAMTKPARD